MEDNQLAQFSDSSTESLAHDSLEEKESLMPCGTNIFVKFSEG